MTSSHPFDSAIALTLDPTPNRFRGHTSPAYANMIGPYGGATAATLLNAVLQHPQHRGEPASLTVNFAGAVKDGEFDIDVQLIRDNRSTQYWNMTLSQQDAIAISASCLLVTRRDSWSDNELTAPDAAPADTLPTLPKGPWPTWISNYDMRFVKGGVTLNPADKSDNSTSLLWIKDNPTRPLDYLSLTAISDCFFPRVFLRTQQLLPASTVTLTTYFHADTGELAKANGYLLARARGNRFGHGFFDQSGHIWGSDGTLLVSTHQLVYFKG